MATSKTRRGARRRLGPDSSTPSPRATGPLTQALIDIRVLDGLEMKYALVGGLAVSARAEPRTTRDVDLAISASSDDDAERLIHVLQSMGYGVVTLVEQTHTARLATARLRKAKGNAVIDSSPLRLVGHRARDRRARHRTSAVAVALVARRRGWASSGDEDSGSRRSHPPSRL